jgi:LysR family transcriptional regulator, glycine cleavage system transcriptional activator
MCGAPFARNVRAPNLRTGRLAAPFDLTLPSGRCYCLVCAKERRESANVRAVRAWLKEEAAVVDG